MWLKGHYHRIAWIPGPASQGYITTTTTIKVKDLGKYHIHHHKCTWVPWPTLQSYVYYNEVTSHRKTMNNGAWLYDYHYRNYRFVWMPPSPQQGYMVSTVTKICGDHDPLCWVTGLSSPALSQLRKHHNHIPEVCEHHHQQHYKVK